nr:hypothetical protein [uncultured Rhodopila sp.]
MFIAIFAMGVQAFQYHGALAESDLYRVLVGMMDGAVSGTGLSSDLHYDREFGFGYLAAFYAFVDPHVLRDPDRLMEVMNRIGIWAILPGLLLMWWAVRLIHGARTATIAIVVFALGPMVPELATSGHPVLPMFAILCAGAVLLFLPLNGWKAVVAAAAGGALLLVGMTVRGELFLAMPWIVLSRADTRSLRGFFVSCLLRSIAPGLALITFVILQHQIETVINSALGTTVSGYFVESYSFATIAPGLVYMAVGCGFATIAAAAVALLYLGWSARSVDIAPRPPLGELLGPLALIIVPLLFFLPNPQPTRHFLMPLAGMAILIGMALAGRLATGRLAALGIALGIGVANQVLAEGARPALLRINEAHSPYLPVPSDYPTTTHANLGWEWRRHAALVDKRERWQALGETLRTSCDTHLIVLSDESEQLFSRLYAGGTPVKANRFIFAVDTGTSPINQALRSDRNTVVVGEGDSKLTGFIGVIGPRTFIIVEKSHIWPGDAVAEILKNPAFADYKIVTDPYTLSKFDKTSVPDDRAAHFGCPLS